MTLLNIVEFEITTPVPKGYQSENVLFDTSSMTVLGSITATFNNLSKLANANNVSIFNDYGRSIHCDKIKDIDYSLALIEVHDVQIRVREDNGHLRAQFTYEHFSL